MTYTLFDATLDLARSVMDVFESAATGGTQSTVVDTANLKTPGWFSAGDGGSLWLHLTPTVSKVITNHATQGTITFTPAQAGAVVVGNRYSASPPTVPLYILKQKIIEALRNLGQIPHYATVVATANKEEYIDTDNPVMAYEITAIDIANALAAPYDWYPHTNWYQVDGAKRALVFVPGHIPEAAYPMRIHYLLPIHPTLTTDASEILPVVEPARLIADARVLTLVWLYAQSEGDKPFLATMVNEAKEQKQQQQNLAAIGVAKEEQERMRALHPVKIRRDVKHSRW